MRPSLGWTNNWYEKLSDLKLILLKNQYLSSNWILLNIYFIGQYDEYLNYLVNIPHFYYFSTILSIRATPQSLVLKSSDSLVYCFRKYSCKWFKRSHIKPNQGAISLETNQQHTLINSIQLNLNDPSVCRLTKTNIKDIWLWNKSD